MSHDAGPDLFYNFSWVVEDAVGGMARPGRDALEWLREKGVTALVSLTLRAPEGFEGIGDLDVLRVPIRDMSSPTLAQLHDLVAYMRSVVEGRGKVVAHCGAGLGRTGTVLAAYLVGDGWTAREAIRQVRALRPGSIETRDQEDVIVRYAELMGRTDA